MKIIPKSLIKNKPMLVKIMAWHWLFHLLSELTMTKFSDIYTSFGLGDLNHSGRVTHICIRKFSIIRSVNVLLPARRQAIIWTNAGILLFGPLGSFSEILITDPFSFKTMLLKMSSGKWHFCLGLNVLMSFTIYACCICFTLLCSHSWLVQCIAIIVADGLATICIYLPPGHSELTHPALELHVFIAENISHFPSDAYMGRKSVYFHYSWRADRKNCPRPRCVQSGHVHKLLVIIVISLKFPCNFQAPPWLGCDVCIRISCVMNWGFPSHMPNLSHEHPVYYRIHKTFIHQNYMISIWIGTLALVLNNSHILSKSPFYIRWYGDPY